MPIITVKEPFKFAEGGNHVIEYGKGVHEVSDRCAEVAIEQLKVATKGGKLPEQNATNDGGDDSDDTKASKPVGKNG
jgi:hypothetical protein